MPTKRKLSYLWASQKCLSVLGFNRQDGQTLSNIPILQRLKVSIFSAITLWLVASSSLFIGTHYSHYILLASLGASCVLLFGLPNSPLAQPWSFVAGHLIPAFVGVSCALLIEDIALMAACTMALSLLCMYSFECIHPPGGATALVPVFAAYQQPVGYEFLLYPVGSGVIILLIMSLIYKHWILRSNSTHNKTKFDPAHNSQNPPPLKRGSLQPEDFLHALNNADTILDIRESDLEALYHQAKAFSFERQRSLLSCASIMSSNLITVTPDTEAEKAWKSFHKHKISSLPVVNNNDELAGMISSVDFLSSLTSKHHSSIKMQLAKLIGKSSINKYEKRTVNELMVTGENLVSVKESDHISVLIPLLSDAGYHNIPVVNQEKKLVGVITQSDLIGGLYQQIIDH